MLRADFGYVFDHATPIGEVVIASPTYYRLSAEFHGRAAHAGIRPEAGRSAMLAAAHAIAAMPHGRIDEQTTANVGSIHGGSGSTNVVPERCRLLAEARSLDPDRVEEVVARMIDAVHDGAGAGECDVDVVCEKLFDGYRTKGTAPAVVAAEAALRACGYEPSRIVTGGGSDANALARQGHRVRQPRQRHRAQPRADRARERRRAGGDARRLPRAARRGRRVEPLHRGCMSSRFERLEARTVFEGAVVDVCEGTFRHEDGEEVTRQWVAHPGSVAIVAHDGEHVWLVRQPREATGVPDLLELPAGKLDEEGESPLECGMRELAEEIGKAAASWEHLTTYFTSAGFTDEQCHIFLATGPAATSPGNEIEDERIDVEPHPLAELDATIAGCRDAKTIIGLQLLRERLSPLNGALHAAGLRPRAANPSNPWPSPTPLPADASRSSTCCSTSSPTSSSSAGCRATRSRPTAPTCCSSASGSGARGHDALAVGHAELSAFAAEIAAGRDDKPPAAPATLQRKVACLRSFYRHLRRTSVLTNDPTAHLRAPKQSRKLPQVLSRDEVAELLRQPRGTEPAALRDRALLETMYACGLRASEAIEPGGRRRRPRGGDPARPRQGLEGAARADRLGGRERARRVPAARARRGWSATAGRRGCSSTSAAAG